MRITHVAFALLILGCAFVAQAEDIPQLILDTGGHMGIVTGLAFTSDGKQLISVGHDKVIRIWDWRAGKTVRTIRGQAELGNEGKIYAVALSQDGRWLAVGGFLAPPRGTPYDVIGAVRLYDFATGEIKKLLKAHDNVVLALAFSPDSQRLISGSSDNSAIIWDVNTRRILHRLSGHQGNVTAVAFNGDGSRLATASEDQTLRLWSADGQWVSTLAGHVDKVVAVAFSSTDESIVSTSWDATVKFWDGKTGQLRRSIEVDCGWGLSYTPDGRFVICSRGLVIDARTGGKTIEYKPSSGRTVAGSPDSRLAATVDEHHAIHVWDIETASARVVLGGTGQEIWALGFSEDGCNLSWGNTLTREQENDLGDLALEIGLPCAGKTISAPRQLSRPATEYTRPVTKHGDNEIVLASSITGPDASANMNLLHVKQGSRTIATLDADTHGFRHQVYTFTPDGKTVLSGGANGYFTAYDIASTEARTFVGHVGYVYAIAVSADGRLAASGATDNTMNIWNLASGELIITFFYGRDGEWVMWTPQGYYTSSPNGDRMVGWQINKGGDQAAEYVTANQLRRHFYRPDIVEYALILASANAAVAQARGTNFSLTELLKRKPPAFDIISPADRSRASATPAEIRLKLEPNNDPVEAIEVLVNGRQATTPALHNATALLGASGTPDRRIEVPLEQGENKIRIVARNKVGQTGRDFVLFHDKPGMIDRRGTLYVLAIGVDKYPHLPPMCGLDRDQSCDLRYAGKDARAFRDVLIKQAGPLYSDIKTLLLARDGDKPPIKANIEDALGEILGKAGPEDTTVLFIAGHGVSDGRGADYLFLPEEAEPSGDGWRKSTVLPWILFQKALHDTQGRRLMFADTCRSGKAYNSRLIKDAADDTIIVFSATDGQTVSWELERLAHGAFTYALIQGFEGKAHKRDGSVTVLGLGEFISEEVANLTDQKQQPTFFISGAKNFMLAARKATAWEAVIREATTLEARAREVLVLAQEKVRDPSVVDMLFATSRKADVSTSNVTFTRERAESLSFGSLRVRIPETHKIGRIELPKTRDFILYKYQQATNEKTHFVLRDITLLNRDSFIEKVKSADRSEVLVFVHGFNNTFEEATFRLAQIVFDIDYKGLPVLFSWAAASGVHGYRHDIDSARLARDLFVDFLQILQEKAEIKTVHIIAHSMGNALVMEALDRIAGEQLPLNIAELIMAAPDVSGDLFKQLAARVHKVVKGMTLYASSKDKALVASKALALDIARAGDVPTGGPIYLPMMDTIDVSALGAEFLGLNHNTFATNRSLIDDIGRLLTSGQRPPGARTPHLKGRPVTINPPQYWLYPE